jgi:protein-S-isoprenylcysteine O-methyltransferase Ste14
MAGDVSVARSLLKSVVHNVGVLIVGFAFAYLGTTIDSALHLTPLAVPFARPAAFLLLSIGFLLRLWAAYHFYEHRMYIISLHPQSTLITTGPYRFSRNPLYLGGNVFVFFGAALLLRSPAALVMTALHLPLIDLFIRREETQLERRFGDDWRAYKSRVRRWL